MNEKYHKTDLDLSRWSPSLECTCETLPPKVQEYIEKQCGKEGLSWIIHAIKTKHWIVLSGPPTTGKSTIRNILWSLGYPFVIDEGEMAFIIHTSRVLPMDALQSHDDILKSLGID